MKNLLQQKYVKDSTVEPETTTIDEKLNATNLLKDSNSSENVDDNEKDIRMAFNTNEQDVLKTDKNRQNKAFAEEPKNFSQVNTVTVAMDNQKKLAKSPHSTPKKDSVNPCIKRAQNDKNEKHKLEKKQNIENNAVEEIKINSNRRKQEKTPQQQNSKNEAKILNF